MKHSEYIVNELKRLGLNNLSNCSALMPYAIPKNYFVQNRFDLIATSIKNEENVYLELSKKTPFASPNPNYFIDLSKDILDRIKNEDLENLSKENPFKIPFGYFEQFPNTLISKINRKPQTQKRQRISLFRTTQMAAAIALFIFVGLGISHFSINQTATQKIDISNLSKAEITGYMNENLEDFSSDLLLNTPNQINSATGTTMQLSQEEITNYLNETGLN